MKGKRNTKVSGGEGRLDLFAHFYQSFCELGNQVWST